MKSIMYFKMKFCPYCIQANKWMKEVIRKHPEYKDINIRVIDENEQSTLANKYDYYYVPTYYIDGEKIHEGVASKAIIEEVFKKAYE